MKKIYLISFTFLLTTFAHAGLYRWVDDSGNVHFSDKVPASASQKSHSKLNKSGDVTQKVDPELKLEKIKQIEIAEKEKLEKEKLRKQKALKLAEIKKRDDILLSTYEDQHELSMFFERKMNMIEGNSKILSAQNKILNNKLTSLKDKASSVEDEESLKNVAKKIVSISNTIKQYQQALLENDEQLNTLANNYKADLTRFNELSNQQ